MVTLVQPAVALFWLGAYELTFCGQLVIFAALYPLRGACDDFEDDPPRSDSFPQDVEARATWNDSFPAGRRTRAKVSSILLVV